MRARRKPVTHFLSHLSTKVRKKLRLGHSLAELDPELAARPLVFEAPPLTPRLVEAIRLISPQFRLDTDEPSRRFWELNQNGLSWGEYLALAPVLESMDRPRRVLDIGPGLGRSAVFFKKKLGWDDVPFDLYDSDGSSTRYTQAGPRFEDSFCGDLEALETILRSNGVAPASYEILDARDDENRLERLEGPYDLVYSFFAVGWHWSIEHFLDDLLRIMSPRAVGAFTLHDKVDWPHELEGRVPFRVVEFKRSWPRERWSRLIVLSPSDDVLQPLA